MVFRIRTDWSDTTRTQRMPQVNRLVEPPCGPPFSYLFKDLPERQYELHMKPECRRFARMMPEESNLVIAP